MIGARGTESVWTAEVPLPTFPILDDLSNINVIIVGGGITGLTTGLLLQRAGISTAVVEQHRVGSGETGRTTAHVTAYIDAGYARLITDVGEDVARLVAQSKLEAIDFIETLAQEISCDFERVPGYIYTENQGDRDTLREQLEMASAAGIAAQFVDRAPLPYATAGAIEFPNQAQFHPGRYLAGLIRLYAEAGGTISEGSHVRSIDEEDGRCRVRTDRMTAYCDHVVSVTDAPITGGTLLDTKLRANRTYALALRVADLPRGLFWDTEEPYHYIRSAVTREGPIVIVGGEDHRTGTDGEQDSLERLERFARERLAVEAVVKAWSGQIMEPVDCLPYIGPREPGSRVYLATGYSGNGITFGTVAARLFTDVIRGTGSAYAEIYSPDRMMAPRQWAKYAAQNLPAAWTLVSDLLPLPRAESLDDLQPGEGRVVRLDGQKVAATRDRSGTLHAVSPTCTHMGCDVAWNALEQTWDCPCHGSRYEPDGRVLHGPATMPLEPLGVNAFTSRTLAKKER
jgi:glycine/D-amino acid oxidase-like deaminating enzyme/nitrite reductase/ring-hydroxylating ferredoxin subunit